MPELSAEQAYVFRHALLRQVAYQLQLPSQRAALHRLALAILENLPGLDAPMLALELAEHARLGADADLDADVQATLRLSEITHSLLGARFAAAMYDAQPCIAACQRALALLPDNDPRKVETLSLLAEQLSRQGRMSEAFAAFARMRELAPESEAAGRGYVHMAWISRAQGKRDDALHYIKDCEDLAERINSERLRGSCEAVRSVLAFDEQRFDQGLALQQRAAERAKRSGDDGQCLSTNANLIVFLLMLGRVDEAEVHADKAQDLATHLRSEDMQAFVLAKRGLICCQRRQYTRACELMTQAAGQARRAGARQRLLEIQSDLAMALIGAGRLDECERVLVEAGELARDVATARDFRALAVKAAMLKRSRGRYAEALADWRNLSDTSADESSKLEAGIEIALCLALLGRFGEAQGKLGELAASDQAQNDFLCGALNCARGLCLQFFGDLVGAREAQVLALKQLQPPVDDCMHDALMAFASMAQAEPDLELSVKTARQGLQEAGRRGVDTEFPSPHVVAAILSLQRIAGA